MILAPATSWQLVAAGPGAGKSAVACQRVSHLVDAGIPAARILLVSFTRTAVTELRDRIISYAVAGERAKSVRISTIDSHAWSLRIGFEDEPLQRSIGHGSYDLSIARTVELFRDENPDLQDFMGRLEHLIIDEAQDIMSSRADLILEMLRSVSADCGLTILADGAQAIYGFTSDDGKAGAQEDSLLTRLETECPRPLIRRTLVQNHRTENVKLTDLFLRARKEIELAGKRAGHIARVQKAIRETCGSDIGVSSYSSIAEFLTRVKETSMLVLFRRRADVLFASSYCSQVGVEHRLRLSETPLVVRPWIGWLLGEVTQSAIYREEFENLWAIRSALASAPFEGEARDAAWSLLHRLAAASWPAAIDLEQLRRIITRTRPPIELCYQDLGYGGPILGTIHASKGREADTVVLVMPSDLESSDDSLNGAKDAQVFEEGRVYYVGATRARKMLVVAGGNAARVGYLDSGRIYRSVNKTKCQLEIGRSGDIDQLAHLAWNNSNDVQRTLALCIGKTTPIHARATPAANYARRLILEQRDATGVAREAEIGQLSESLEHDIKKLWSRFDKDRNLRPGPMLPHLYLVGVTTVAVPEDKRSAVKAPFTQSALGLAPVVKGFPTVQFLFRNRRASSK